MDFLRLVQRRIGNTSVGPSTARGMGPAGTIASARSFLQSLDLGTLAATSESVFIKNLDAKTLELKRSLPYGARNWGSARKFLNIFLRGCLYNRYLSEHYGLTSIEPWLELPLDSHVADALHERDEAGILPKWRTVIRLTPQESAKYQSFASEVAAKEGIQRIHLDLIFWRPEQAANQALERARKKRRVVHR